MASQSRVKSWIEDYEPNERPYPELAREASEAAGQIASVRQDILAGTYDLAQYGFRIGPLKEDPREQMVRLLGDAKDAHTEFVLSLPLAEQEAENKNWIPWYAIYIVGRLEAEAKK